ncbi:MAG TPA: sugar MFS transporter [Bacteroidales bacterium]|nr:sugar MFS transporter [Bacteroidales bacterium]HRX97339.1 sugar MFS transporter [Bacteroidales bacterium]
MPIIIIGALFFIFGFVTWLNATLIPYLKISCELTSFESYLVAFAFYISYFVMALPSSAVLKKTGFKNGMSVGLITMAIGALIFIPAAYTRTYGLFLTGLFIQGTGLTILQTASNPYVTILGPIESAAKRISIMGVANKFAGILSPIILGAVVLTGIDDLVVELEQMDPIAKAVELDILAQKVIMPYLIMAGVLVLLAALVRYSTLPEVEQEEEKRENADNNVKRTSIWQYPYLLLGVATIFVYVGVEVIAVDTLISYGNYLGFDFAEAKFFASFTLGAMIAGYFFGILTIPKFISQQNALKYFAILGVLFSITAIFTSGFTSILMIAALGFANSIMWPAIWPLAIDGLGKFMKTGSAMLIMGIAGGALLPLVYGALADVPSIGSQQAYWIMVPCYLFILYFAAAGHKIGKLTK